MALIATTTASFAVTQPAIGAAAAACSPLDAPPQVLGVTAQDVTFGRSSGGFARQAVRVTVRNACGGSSTYECSSDPTTSCTGGLSLQFRRSGQVGTAARSCSHRASSQEADSGWGPVATSQPDVYDYSLSKDWSFRASDAPEQPAMTNACAGPWDIVVTPWRATTIAGTYSSTPGEPFTATAVFSLFRGARLTASASPELVRRGATVTVKGRLTRQAMTPSRGVSLPNIDKYVGSGGESVLLQRRTLSGTYNTLRTVRSTWDGHLTTKLKALAKDHCYRWLYRGSATTLPVTSGGDCVHLRR
jgi:hypothetical protein